MAKIIDLGGNKNFPEKKQNNHYLSLNDISTDFESCPFCSQKRPKKSSLDKIKYVWWKIFNSLLFLSRCLSQHKILESSNKQILWNFSIFAFLCTKMPHLFHFEKNMIFYENQNSRFESIINACNQDQLHKNLINKFRGNLKQWFWTHKSPINLIVNIIRFALENSTVTSNHSLMPVTSYNFRKI